MQTLVESTQTIITEHVGDSVGVLLSSNYSQSLLSVYLLSNDFWEDIADRTSIQALNYGGDHSCLACSAFPHPWILHDFSQIELSFLFLTAHQVVV